AEDISFERFKNVYAEAYDLNLKGCTTFRPNPITGSVLSPTPVAPPPPPNSMASPRVEGPTTSAAAEQTMSPPPHLPNKAAIGLAGMRNDDTSQSDAVSLHPHTDDDRGVVYMSPPLARDPVLSGFTYKLKW